MRSQPRRAAGLKPATARTAEPASTPIPVATAALDDGARAHGFDWDATWNPSFSDFLVSQVGGESATSTQFWGHLVNFTFPSVGGCQQKVDQGDEVLWVFDAFSKTGALKLSGPGSATIGAPVTVLVTDGSNGTPQAGVTVNGSATGPDGKTTLSFSEAGIYRLKAERADSIRSNALVLCVDPQGADPCTSTDKTGPALAIDLPGKRLASERGRSRTMLVSWQADDSAGAGVSYYSVDVREVPTACGRARSSRASGSRSSIAPRSPGVDFRGDSGHAYQFRITAVDRAANRTEVETDPLVLPVDDRDRGLLRFSRGWKRIQREAAWGRTVMKATTAGDTATLRFKGRSVALIGRRLQGGGRLRVSVAGKSRALELDGRGRNRSCAVDEPQVRRRQPRAAHPLARRRPRRGGRGGPAAVKRVALDRRAGGVLCAGPPRGGPADDPPAGGVQRRLGRHERPSPRARRACAWVEATCTAGRATALAALVRSEARPAWPARLRLVLVEARDGGGLFVESIRGDVNRGQNGWVYKVGRRAATAGAADPTGPFGHGRLRNGQSVTWFYCRLRAAAASARSS